MTSKDLDRIDRKILRSLQADGRISNVELARRVGLSPTPCLERVRRLERDGYILGYGARLLDGKLEAGMLVFVQVTLERTTPDVFDRFAAAVQRLEEVAECHMVAGGYDYLLKVRVRDMAAFRRFLGDGLTALDSVRETHTYVVMEAVKDGREIPVPEMQDSAH